jgi:hemerythrin-like metal-binding protein
MTKKITPDPYPWKREYELDNEFFDEQTKKFLEIINLMKELVATGDDSTDISEVFFQLAHYFERYMLREEIYLKELQYDRLERHYKAHKEFSQRIVSFREGFEKGEKGFALEMYDYLEKWFDDHMMIDDRRAVNFIKEHTKKS